MAEKPVTAEASQLIEVEIARDWWDENGVRQVAGTLTMVSMEVALEGFENGALRRPKKGKKSDGPDSLE